MLFLEIRIQIEFGISNISPYFCDRFRKLKRFFRFLHSLFFTFLTDLSKWNVTHMSPICHRYATRMFSYGICISLVCVTLVHGKTTFGWHTSTYEWHTDDIRGKYKWLVIFKSISIITNLLYVFSFKKHIFQGRFNVS